MRISVVVPCRNAVRHVGAAMAGALEQLGPEDEVVVQDACSTDGTDRVLAAIGDPRLRVRSEPDSGQSEALNRAVERATGDFVGWLNADDLLLPGALDAVRAAAGGGTGDGVDVVVGGWRLLDAAGATLREEPARPLDHGKLLLHGCYAFSGAVFIRRSVLRGLGGLAEDLHYTMDYDLMLRLARTRPRQALAHAPLAALRYHADSKSGGAGRRFFTEAITVRRAQCATAPEVARGVAGTVIHGVGVATARLRFGGAYTRLRKAVAG
ncbi:glycosyltransferase [Actinokineospora guangxiensis]|uniref:Glycosyltransferase n=1 Tax=Actinokineospora guangxiensis TaxID=1490288 RepID=A0ABW0EIP0_9PSEU